MDCFCVKVRHRLLPAQKHWDQGESKPPGLQRHHALLSLFFSLMVFFFFFQPLTSDHGLLTTVAYKLGKDKPACYALEVLDLLLVFRFRSESELTPVRRYIMTTGR